MTTFAVIAGGGTAGHVVPGLAIADALVARGHGRDTIHFVGSRRGIERTMVPAAGYGVTLLRGRGIQRRLTPANAGAAAGLAAATWRSVSLIRRRRPAVLVALGGYASVPAAVAAVLWRVPIVVAEQNAVPGAANRLIARFATSSAVSFEGTALPRAVVTGNPLRPEIRRLDRRAERPAARDRLGIAPAQTAIVAFGGSLGARRINDAMVDLAERWRDRDDVAIRHVIGERDWDRYTTRTAALHGARLRYEAVRYEHDMPTAYAAADVVVARAGATTVAELAAVGLPAILIPLPHSPGDHQRANARALVDAGAAVLVDDGDLDGARLASVLDPLIADAGTRERMGQAARAAARVDAADRVADLVERHARRPGITPRAGRDGQNGRP